MPQTTPMMPLRRAFAWLHGATLVGDGDTPVMRVHTDTRSLSPGDLFVALQGERFDANDFLAEAQARGASALLCRSGLPPAAYPPGVARIEVHDTRAALAALARAWRMQFDLPLIAVTGSNGKTTVTQMLASILQAHAPGDGSLATQGNLNNDIGVPLTLLRLRDTHRIAVVELGMNHPGEIAALADCARPTVALVNNAQREHLEFMHSVDAVAQENGSVLAALHAHGVAVFPSDDTYSALWQSIAGARKVARFGGKPGLPHSGNTLVCRSALWSHGAWRVHAQSAHTELHLVLHIAGRHNVQNALAAASCALAAGVGVAAVEVGLARFVPVKGRSRAMEVALAASGHRFTLVDDSYNANPDSVRAAIDVLAELPGPRLLVLGDMGEVGSEGVTLHAEAGRYAKACGIDRLFTLGELAASARAAFGGAQHFGHIDALLDAVRAALPEAASVLVKGSRFMRMERVVQAITEVAQAEPEGGTVCC
jgi:UDP-N-acetylmuramoyl-tripeptide--D-alanyl-D-alanine ligase